MRSPWKIIADIAGRRKSDQTVDLPVAIHELHDEPSASPDVDQSDVADKPVAHEVVVEDTAQTAAGESQVAEPGDRYVPTAAIVQSASSNEIQSIDPGTIEPLKVAPIDAAARSKPEQAKASKTMTARRRTRQSVVVTKSDKPKRFEDEIALDNEISSLRSQLAEKLALQNEQLKSMLDRYA